MAETIRDIREYAERGLRETAGLISRRDYNLSIVRARQTAELIVKSYAEEKNLEYDTLADTIERLFRNDAINRTSRDAFHSIRLYGNKAVHEEYGSPEDAQKAYYLLKNEVGTFNSHKMVNVDRTPVRVERPRHSESDYRQQTRKPVRREESRQSDDAPARRPAARTDADRPVKGSRTGGRGDGARQDAGRAGGGQERRRSGGSQRQGKARPKQKGMDINIYSILRIAIPVVALILIVIIIKTLIPSKDKTPETTAAPTTAIEMTEPETTAAETEPAPTEPETQPPVYEYRVKGDGVNVRYADNQNRIYTQLSRGTAIGTVTEIEGSDFVQFTLDGVNVVIRKDFIEPIQ